MVSVIIPLYNKAPHIRRAVESVMRQSFEGFECLVVDDGSTDGGGDIVEGIADSRLRLVRQSNGGVSAARNRGIELARHSLVAFLDADDEWLPGFLQTVMNLHARYPAAGMYATAYCQQHDGIVHHPVFLNCIASTEGGLLEDYFRAALAPVPVCSSAVMIPKHILGEVGCFPAGVSFGEDSRTWAAIALRYPVAWSPAAGAIYHMSAINRACILVPPPAEIAAVETIELFLKEGGRPISSLFYIQEYIVRLCLDCANARLLVGRKDRVRDLVVKAAGTVLFRKRLWRVRVMAVLPSRLVHWISVFLREVRRSLAVDRRKQSSRTRVQPSKCAGSATIGRP